ncbi:hypothetical protein [Cellvibrio mixtus]|uniref:hypothetical protein n=1 Tax=Cellvibrio mixtus TaxID=39650 RepID=UPI000587719B|nr:hypothetical protein [Cellvibrio mixtus]
MNELQRQTYLSALGIENYMPRWRLPNAPEPVACVMPVIDIGNDSSAVLEQTIPAVISSIVPSKVETAITIDVLANLDVRQKPSVPINAAAILQQLEEKKPAVVAPFSLSVWRPVSGFLIIDSRNTTLALPTDLFLNNILRVCLTEKFNLSEEVLRWPMIENRYVSRTEIDARNELQTWLAVENELRPINRLWLLGEASGKYFIGDDMSAVENRWKKIAINSLSGQVQVTAMLLPSLNELLQNPSDKARLWSMLD